MKRIIACFLAVITAISFTLTVLSYNGDFGYISEVLSLYEDQIAPGVTYTEVYGKDPDGDSQNAFIFEYTPGMGTIPLIQYGEYLYGKEKLSQLAAEAEAEGYEVVAGVNGDFFSTLTGIPMSVIIKDGKLITSCDGRNAIGFKEDHSVIVGNPNIQVTIDCGINQFHVDYVNKYPSVYGVYLLTPEFSPTTESTSTSRELIVQIDEDVKSSGTYGCKVVAIYTNGTNAPIPDGCVAIVINNEYFDFDYFQGIDIGDRIYITVTCDEEWKDVVCAIGGSDIILNDGEIVESAVTNESHAKQPNPRTVIGVTEEGKVIIFAVDGRQSGYSSGMTLSQAAECMKSMGCVQALNLDGGGSTTVLVQLSYEENWAICNRPSDGSERPIANGFFLVNAAEATNIPANLLIQPKCENVLKDCLGADAFTVILRDTAFKKMYELTDTDIQFSFEPENTETGLGRTKVVASTEVEGVLVSGIAYVNVVDSIDSFSLSAAKKGIGAGEVSEVQIRAFSQNQPVYLSPLVLEWSFDVESDGLDRGYASCSYGYLDKDLSYHAYYSVYDRQTITLKATYEELSQEFTFDLYPLPEVLFDFEGDFDPETVFVTESNRVILAPSGKKSEFAVILSGNELKLMSPLSFSYPFKGIRLWAKGIVEGAYALFRDADGNQVKYYYKVLADYSRITGWYLLEVMAEDESFQNLTLTSVLCYNSESVDVLVDDITINYGSEQILFTDTLEHWSDSYVKTLYQMDIVDGEIIDGEKYFNPTRPLKRSEFAKMLVAFLQINMDNYANIELPFTDLNDFQEWSVPYIKAIVGEGIMNGKGDLDGTVRFCPNDYITRVEVMYVIGTLISKGMLSVEIAEGAMDPSQTWKDWGEVYDWAKENVQTVVSCGIITGYSDGTIQPKNNLNRAEAATIFARISNLL